MEEKRHIGIAARCLNHEIGRAVRAVISEEFGDSATGVQSWIVRYLYDHGEEDVFQKDLESQFSVRRSTMTTILQLMEKNGLIKKESVSRDARLKKLILTPAAIEMQDRIRSGIDTLEAKMREGISDKDLGTFFFVAEKIKENLPAIQAGDINNLHF